MYVSLSIMKKLFILLLTVLSVLLVFSCKKAKEEIPVSSVSISQPAAEMIEGETVQLQATVLPADATDKKVIWASSKQSVATITDKGLVTAIAEGTSTVTATAGGKTATCQITVSKRVVEVTSVTLNKETLELVEGGEETLTATVLPENATDKTVEWSSSSPDIASVDGGKVSAIKEGDAVITAKAGTKSATCKVVVTKSFIAVESIELDTTTLELAEGETSILVATVRPHNATDKTVTWVSSDDSVVTVDNDGKVKAIKEGKAAIVAKAGEKTAKCEVTVNKKVIAVESITLNKNSASLKVGETVTLTATVKPDDATNKTVTWSTSDDSVAEVNDGVVTAKKVGSASITAKAGDKEATCAITVEATPVTSVTLDKTTATLKVGETVTLTATVKPDDATDKTVTWSTSDASVAEVNDGVVTAKKVGSASITAKAGDKEATCAITVEATPVTSITLDKTSASLKVGETVTLTATVKPDDATDKTVTWSTSDASVAEVNEGVVTARKAGSASITAKAGSLEAVCIVSVEAPVTLIDLGLPSGLKWAEVNLGANAPEEYGDYFAWGETEPKSDYSWSAYAFGDGQSVPLIKYNTDSKYGAVDNKTILDLEDDAAHVLLGGSWRMPTADDWNELRANCTMVWTSQKGVNGYKFTGPNGNSIFLPAAGNCYYPDDNTDGTYWASSLWAYDSRSASSVLFYSSRFYVAGVLRRIGQSVRPVYGDLVRVTGVTVSPSSTQLEVGETAQFTATVSPSNASVRTVTWSSSDSSVASVDGDGNVTAKAQGTATITATAQDGMFTSSCSVTVISSIAIDGNFDDWNSLGKGSFSQANSNAKAKYPALTHCKVYATAKYIYVYFEWNPSYIYPDMEYEWVPFHCFINTDGSSATGGDANLFADPSVDVLLEGFLYEGGVSISPYDPRFASWAGDPGGTGWAWSDILIPNGTDACDGAGIQGKYEIRIERAALSKIGFPVADEFSIGFDIEQSWDTVGVLPNEAPSVHNQNGLGNTLKVKTVK